MGKSALNMSVTTNFHTWYNSVCEYGDHFAFSKASSRSKTVWFQFNWICSGGSNFQSTIGLRAGVTSLAEPIMDSLVDSRVYTSLGVTGYVGASGNIKYENMNQCKCSRVPVFRGPTQHDTLLRTVLQWLGQNLNETPRRWSFRASYGCLLWGF